MKILYTFFLCGLLSFSVKAQYSSQNINLIGHWYNPSQEAEPVYGIKYNSVWGWVHPKSKIEYAILGSGSGTSFIDLSSPSSPKLTDYVSGKRNKCIWREYKTYKNYVYGISDDGGPNSFQIIDMSYLPDSVHVVYDGTDLFERAHTLFIDGDQLYLASTKQPLTGEKASLAVYSLANPEKPVLLRTLKMDFPAIEDVHDMFVRNDTVYASCGYQGLFIYKYDKSANKFIGLSSIESYKSKGYNHSSALTPDGRTLVFCDEVPRDLPIKIANIADLNNISVDTYFKSVEGPTPHNPYLKGKSHVVVAYYQDGLQIFDIRDPKFPVRTGYFDTDTIDGPANNYNPSGTAYHGNWGAYIDLRSGYILASDMQNGLFILNADQALGISNSVNDIVSDVHVYPNPSNDVVSIQFHLQKSETLSFEILDMTGRKLFSKTENEPAGIVSEKLDLHAFDNGMYLIKISGKEISYASKLLKN